MFRIRSRYCSSSWGCDFLGSSWETMLSSAGEEILAVVLSDNIEGAIVVSAITGLL